jgi:hypothetical protein
MSTVSSSPTRRNFPRAAVIHFVAFAIAADTALLAKFDRKTLEFMAEAARDGKPVIPISLKMPLSEAAEAQAKAEEGGVGKILLLA